VWNEELNELRAKLNKWNSQHQLIFRQFVSDVEVVMPDSNGRILLPKRFLQICHIQSDIRFIGSDNKMEIWAKERTEQPFMAPEEFGAALEKIMNDRKDADGEQ
jgi:MraZ protein